ncbi:MULTISPECIES: hypothetical protein [Pantoea]|uniref:hypothetical protein n=1 Tax=Pantoea TaxID=53335 RepID=UPI0028933F47|nr:hypothetical protein [Pantoea sp. UBA5923]
MLTRLRNDAQHKKLPTSLSGDACLAELIAEARSFGWSEDLNDAGLALLARSFAAGGSFVKDGRRYYARDKKIKSEPVGFVSNWWRVSRRRNKGAV